jgi:hypothetical protein
MKLWVMFIVGSFLIGVVGWRQSWSTRAKIVAGLAMFVLIGYFFLNQI